MQPMPPPAVPRSLRLARGLAFAQVPLLYLCGFLASAGAVASGTRPLLYIATMVVTLVLLLHVLSLAVPRRGTWLRLLALEAAVVVAAVVAVVTVGPPAMALVAALGAAVVIGLLRPQTRAAVAAHSAR